MAGEVKQKTQWDVEPCYIGDDVYHGMDIVTDIDDHEGNPFVVSVQTGSPTTDKQIAGQIVREHNSHDAMLAALLQAKSTLSDPTKDFCPHCGGPASLDDHATHCPLGIAIAAINKATEQD